MGVPRMCGLDHYQRARALCHSRRRREFARGTTENADELLLHLWVPSTDRKFQCAHRSSTLLMPTVSGGLPVSDQRRHEGAPFRKVLAP